MEEGKDPFRQNVLASFLSVHVWASERLCVSHSMLYVHQARTFGNTSSFFDKVWFNSHQRPRSDVHPDPHLSKRFLKVEPSLTLSELGLSME